MKLKLNEDVFSPSFIRLANFYFMNEQFEECINVCTIGLQVFPGYTTAKIILIKALLKLGYASEAENLFAEIEHKISYSNISGLLKKAINDLKLNPGQERIFYPENIHPSVDFRNYKDLIDDINELKNEFDFEEFEKLVESQTQDSVIEENIFKIFSDKFNEFKLDNSYISKSEPPPTVRKEKEIVPAENLFLSKIRILTETITDIYVKQGFLKEAFEAYNILLKQDNQNKERIREKLNELERHLHSQ